MLGLPKSTEISHRLPKNALQKIDKISAAQRARIDADVAKMMLVHEIRPDMTTGGDEKGRGIFVLQLFLKTPTPDEKALTALSAAIPQRIVCVLTYGDKSCLAVYHTTWLRTDWQETETLRLPLRGTTTDAVWAHIVAGIGCIPDGPGTTLAEHIRRAERRKALEKEIERLDKKARAERQPRRKYELYETLKAARAEWEKLGE